MVDSVLAGWRGTVDLRQRQRDRTRGRGPARSISSNLSEGYGRTNGPERARYYDYAISSARETRDWYFKARHLLSATVVAHRTSLVTQIIRLLLTMVSRERRSNRKVTT